MVTRKSTRGTDPHRKSKPGGRQRPLEPAPSSSEAGRTNLLLEHVTSQMQLVIEAVESGDASLGRRIDDLERRFSTEIGDLRLVVHSNTESLMEHSTRIETFSRVTEAHSEKIETLSRLTEAHSQQIGANTSQLRDHSTEIQEFRVAVERVEAKLDRKADAEAVAALDARVAVMERRTL